MDAAVTVGSGLAEAGVIVAALLAAAAVLLPSPRGQALAVVGALLLTPILLVAHIWETPQFAPIRQRPLLGLAGAVVALAALAGAAALIDRRPVLLPVAALAVLPFRVPIESGGTTANLLVPLYFVIAAGGLAFAIPRLRGAREADPPGRRPGALEWLLVGLVVLYAIQATYSTGFVNALVRIVFFYVPFALLFVLLRRVEWTERLAMASLGVLTGLALALSAVGFVEYATRTVFLNPEVIASNQFQSYFRVNSLFFDPNIFGRFLVVVMVALAAAALWTARARLALAAGLALAVLFGGLVLTLSQSSLGALLVGLAVLAAVRWSARWTLAVCLLAAALAVIVVAAFPGALRLKLGSDESIQAATSGRGELIAGGYRLWERRPIAGWGSGAYEPQYRVQERVSGARAITASHTIPVTIAAEQGVIGLAVYLALLVAAFVRLLRGARGSALKAALSAAFAALVFHTWLYAAFLEDPLVWALLAIATAVGWQAAVQAPPVKKDKAPDDAAAALARPS